MRPPLSEIEPVRLGVEIATRGDDLIAVSRVCAAPAGAEAPGTTPGALGAVPGAATGAAPGAVVVRLAFAFDRVATQQVRQAIRHAHGVASMARDASR